MWHNCIRVRKARSQTGDVFMATFDQTAVPYDGIADEIRIAEKGTKTAKANVRHAESRAT